MDTKFKLIIIAAIGVVVVCLATVLVFVLTMPDLPTTDRKDQICLPGETGQLKCGSTTDLLHKYLEKVVLKHYDEVKTADQSKQQEQLDKNKDHLLTSYDKSFWEIKPAAKLTGKEKPPLRGLDNGADMVPIREWCEGREGRELCDTNGF